MRQIQQVLSSKNHSARKDLLFELSVINAEVKAVINSQPLFSESMDDLNEPLTPSHLLTGH